MVAARSGEGPGVRSRESGSHERERRLPEWMVGATGVEPARIAPQDPKSCASANSATRPQTARRPYRERGCGESFNWAGATGSMGHESKLRCRIGRNVRFRMSEIQACWTENCR